MTLAFVHADIFYDLDHLRHFLAFAFNPNNWITNGSEQVIALAVGACVTYLVWPRLRSRVDEWVKEHLHHHREEADRMHRVALAEHRKALDADHRQALAELAPKRTRRST